MTANIQPLSLPKSIIPNNNDDTFSKDLLRQFDKKRSRLHFELGFTSQEPSPESSSVNTVNNNTDSFINEEPIQLDHALDDDDDIMETTSKRTSYTSKRSSSATDLLRRSSAYLKSKFDLLKKNKSQDDYRHSRPRSTIVEPSNPRSTKLLMKTTISIPSMTNNSNTNPSIINPPIITQYPPKPLVYSPIEPIPTMSRESKPLLHRISMPLMRVYNQDSPLTRNKSISSLVARRRKSEPDDHTKRKLRRN